jgi:hypothetical protein
MFLDTDVSLYRALRARVLAASPYSLGEIEHVLIDEVWPVCHRNLGSVAGVWSGFDQAWLEQRILRRLASPLRRLHAINLGRLTVPRWSEWQATQAGIANIRAADEGAADG